MFPVVSTGVYQELCLENTLLIEFPSALLLDSSRMGNPAGVVL